VAEMKSPIELLLSLLTDVRRLEPDVKGLDRDIVTIKKRYENEGDGFLTIALPALGAALDRGFPEGKFACPPGFSKPRGGTIPRLFSGMFCKVFDIETGLLVRGTDNEGVVKCLREILFLFKKLGLTSDQDENLDRKARAEFFEVENACVSDFNFSEKQHYILDCVSRYIVPNLDNFEVGDLNYKHGPGAVFEGLKANQKWNALLVYSNKLDHLGFDCIYASYSGYVAGSGGHNLPEYGASGDTAKLITVLKSSTARRTITIEPVVRQFVQQGFNTWLRDNIARCSVLGNCLALTDQSKNQRLALEGSRTGYWATIDLKSASDLLSTKVVETVFRYRPRFLEELISCRSPNVKDGRSVHTLDKYAGMGNATTFPVQSVVFATLAIAALLEGQSVRPTYRNVQRVSRLVRVYGDDIIVPSELAHQVVVWLLAVGLKVNLKKSFTVGDFRESCGVDAYRGYDVTPLYVRHHPDKTSKKEPSTIAHYVSLSNLAWLRGLYAMSTCLSDHVEELIRKKLPLVRSDCGLLGLHTHQGAQEFHRWNRELQRPETKGYMLLPVKRKDSIDGYAALLKFFLTPLLGRGKGHLEFSPVRFQNRIAQRVVP
jgi:hypothetical protein